MFSIFGSLYLLQRLQVVKKGILAQYDILNICLQVQRRPLKKWGIYLNRQRMLTASCHKSAFWKYLKHRKLLKWSTLNFMHYLMTEMFYSIYDAKDDVSWTCNAILSCFDIDLT